MDENTVVTSTETPVDAGGEISAADLLADESAETVEQSEVDAPGAEEQTEQDDDKQVAFGREMQRVRNAERQRYERELEQYKPAISTGERILRDIMRATGMPLEQAAQVAEQQYIRAVAAREGVTENVARAMFLQGAPQAQNNSQPDISARADEIRADLASMDMPQGFDFDAAIQDEHFAQMLLDMPTQYAVRLYHAEQAAQKAPLDVAEKLRARQGIPQPGKPQQAVSPVIDFDSMSSEDFRAFKARKQQAEMRGQRVRL